MGGIIDKFFKKTVEIVLVGIENSGKTTLLNQFRFPEEDPAPTAPTLGASYRTAKSKGVQMKVKIMWDLGGQTQFRSEWPKYTQGANAVIFLLDSSNPRSFPTVKNELHALLQEKSLKGVPLLILGNKMDIKEHADQNQIVKGFISNSLLQIALNLESIKDNDWQLIMISALLGRQIRPVIGSNWIFLLYTLDWLVQVPNKKQ